LQRRVDGHHAVVLRHYKWIVGVRDRPELKARVLVNAIEQALRSQDEGHDCLAAKERFPLSVQHARLDQIDNSIRTHLGVNAQVALVAEALENRFGDAADAGLQRGAIGNERGHIARNAQMRFGAGLGVEFEQGARCLDNR
jgi:hypothetical protein